VAAGAAAIAGLRSVAWSRGFVGLGAGRAQRVGAGRGSLH
jgi:hypothetical protein